MKGAARLQGTLPSEFNSRSLPQLELLDLSDTAVSGSIPLFPSRRLRVLSLRNTQLRGRFEDLVAALDTLGSGILEPSSPDPCSENTLPPAECSWRTFAGSRAEWIDLHGAHLISGTIPESISRLSYLRMLNIQGTGISGTLPLQLSRMGRLRELFSANTSVNVADSAVVNDNSLGVGAGCQCQWARDAADSVVALRAQTEYAGMPCCSLLAFPTRKPYVVTCPAQAISWHHSGTGFQEINDDYEFVAHGQMATGIELAADYKLSGYHGNGRNENGAEDMDGEANYAVPNVAGFQYGNCSRVPDKDICFRQIFGPARGVETTPARRWLIPDHLVGCSSWA